MTTVITVTVPPPAVEVVQVKVPGIQGPSVLSVGPTNRLTPGIPGLWLQTGLGDGTDFTLWFEDGNS